MRCMCCKQGTATFPWPTPHQPIAPPPARPAPTTAPCPHRRPPPPPLCRFPGAQQDYVICGSDSGRIVILQYSKDKNCFTRVHQETYGKSGCRRIVPGEFLAVDPKGRACMIAAVEKSKFVYVLNRDNDARLTISSPLEAHKGQTLCYGIAGLDMGFDNPVFAAIELDYAEADQVRALDMSCLWRLVFAGQGGCPLEGASHASAAAAACWGVAEAAGDVRRLLCRLCPRTCCCRTPPARPPARPRSTSRCMSWTWGSTTWCASTASPLTTAQTC